MPRKDKRPHSAVLQDPDTLENEVKPKQDKIEQVPPPLPPPPPQDTGPTEAVILHPGSSTLHLGLASDLSPHSVPHYIAYRYNSSAGDGNAKPRQPHGVSSVLTYGAELTPDLVIQRKAGLSSLRQALCEARERLGVVEPGKGEEEECALFNARTQPVSGQWDDAEEENVQWTDVSSSPKYVIGTDALYLAPDSGYRVFKPLRYGKLNVASDCPHSLVLNMLEDLWTKAIEDFLGIPRKEFKMYRVVLVVPDMIDRSMFKEFMNILLLRMEFASALLHQESLCATYSAGLSIACVVNVGDERTHICCVEEGVSNPNTRVTLHYGGSDITRLFYWLLKEIHFPYKGCSESSLEDGQLVQHLKETLCHLDPTITGIRAHAFSVTSRETSVVHDYEMKLSDQGILAAMGVFYPSTFCLPDRSPLMFGQVPPPPDPEDLFDEGHWLDSQPQQQSRPVPVKCEVAPELLPEATKRLGSVHPGKILGLDQAIHFSIDCASSLEIKKKLYSSILVVGGGLSFGNVSNMLNARLQLKLPIVLTKGLEDMEIFTNPRDLDSSIVAWRGGAVLKCLDTCQELWIEKQEWEFSGVRLLRERAPFAW
ncbi:hypothetical protein EMCRGX_G027548 [Ephydatia muelleri]